MKWQAYPKYKDSGIEWLGEVPIDWNVMPLKYVCRESALYGANVPASEYVDEGVRFIRTTDIDDFGQLGTNDAVYLAPSLVAEYMLEDGELLLSRSGTIGRSFVYDEEKHGDCAYAGYLVGFKPKSMLSPRFAFYFTKAKQFEEWLSLSVISSTIGNVNAQKYANMPLPIPPPPEQRAIAAFLDRGTERLDALIAGKERQVELLQEKRATLISHSVTKGLDPNAPMKDSGVEWLGEIPKHWEVQKLKHIASARFSNVDKHTVDGEQPVRLCNYVDVYYNDYITADLDFMKATAKPIEIAKFELKKGDVIVTKDSETWDDIAVPAYVSTDLNGVLCGYHLAQIRSNADLVDGEYLFRSFCARGINDQFRVAATGITRYGLGKHGLDNALFLVPPVDEQRAIATFLDRETERLDALVKKVQESIAKLREYRTALISAAVTGKIQVQRT